jgi:hypothetical protein
LLLKPGQITLATTRKFENEYGVNWYWYCINNPVNYLDPTGLIVHIISYGLSAYIGVGGQFSFGWTWDEMGNKGVIITGGIGVGVHVGIKGGKQSTGTAKGKGFNILGFGYSTVIELGGLSEDNSSQFGPVTIDDKNNVSIGGELGLGLHDSGVVTIIIPCKSASEAAKEAWELWINNRRVVSRSLCKLKKLIYKISDSISKNDR